MKTFLFTGLFLLAFTSLSAQFELIDLDAPYGMLSEGGMVYFFVEASSNNDRLTYRWDFGDGTNVVTTNTGMGHIYPDNGRYTVTVMATNEEGQESSISKRFTIENNPPQILLVRAEESEFTDRMVFFQSVVYDVPDDRLLYKWDFGDGNTEEGINYKSPIHQYAQKGFYRVVLTVQDKDGDEDSYTFIIAINEDWGARITGAITDSLSGGAGLFYFHNPETDRCNVLISLYDDVSRSILGFVGDSPKGITDREIYLSNNYNNGMSASLGYDIAPGVYEASKATTTIWDQATNMDLLSETFSQLSQLDIMRGNLDMEDDAKLGDNFTALKGKLTTSPLYGNKLYGNYTVILQEDLGPWSEEQPRLIDAKGSFEININELSMEQMKNGCENVGEEFILLQHSPENEQHNVHPEYACIRLHFSEPVDLNSFNNQNVQLGYWHTNGNFITTPLQFQQLDPRTVQAQPSVPLKYAVKYEMNIYAGSSGIKSQEAGELYMDYKWKFQTLVIPQDFNIRVYQSIQDKPLVSGKETLVRTYINWDLPQGVAPRNQVTSFRAPVVVRNAGGSAVTAPMPDAKFVHPDYVTEEDIRMAKNSVNVYGWKPGREDGDHISVQIEPQYHDCVPPEARQIIKLNHPITHYDKALTFTVDYYYLKIGEWKDGISPDLKTLARRAMDNTCRFSEQNYPILKMVANERTEYEADPLLYQDELDGDTEMILATIWNTQVLNRVLRDFYYEVGIHSSADAVLVFHPELPGPSAGANYSHLSILAGERLPLGTRFMRMKLVPGLLPRCVIAHELGHAFTLEHEPYVPPGESSQQYSNTPLRDMERWHGHNHLFGFRIYGNGTGANKSCSEGNAEDEKLVNLMFPDHAIFNRNQMFINGPQYDQVMQHFDVTMGGHMGYHSIPATSATNLGALMPSLSPQLIKDQPQDYLQITGRIFREKASIKEIKKVNIAPGQVPTTGDYLIQSYDAKEILLDKAKFSMESMRESCSGSTDGLSDQFVAYLPYRENVHKFKVEKDETPMASFEVSSHAPVVRFKGASRELKVPNHGAEISWEASDGDQDQLFYRLYYSSNGASDWQLLSTTTKNRFALDPASLQTGYAPTLRIVCSDGYHNAEDMLTIKFNSSLEVILYGPNRRAADNDRIFVQFNNPVLPMDILLGNHLFLVDKGSGQPVPCEMEYNMDARLATLHPLQALEKGKTYMIFLSTVNMNMEKSPSGKIQFSRGEEILKDQFGNELEQNFVKEFVY